MVLGAFVILCIVQASSEVSLTTLSSQLEQILSQQAELLHQNALIQKELQTVRKMLTKNQRTNVDESNAFSNVFFCFLHNSATDKD